MNKKDKKEFVEMCVLCVVGFFIMYASMWFVAIASGRA